MSGALATLFKAVLVIGVCSIFIFIYTLKDKKRKILELVEKKPELEMIEEYVQEMEWKMLEIEEGELEFDKKKAELNEEKSVLEERKSELKIEQNNAELDGENKKLEEEEEKPKLNDDDDEPELEIGKTKGEPEEEELEIGEKKAELEEEELEIGETKGEPEEKKAELEEKKEEEECDGPKTNILFLKTHKTGSTTIMKILHHFANKNQLLIAEKINRDQWPHKFLRCSIFPLKPGYEYNIFTHHAVFNYEEMRAVMPDDTKFLTILRDPVAQFESTYGYFGLEDVYGMNLTEFANLDTLDPQWSEIKRKRLGGWIGVNSNTFDLGIDPGLFDSDAAILEKAKELDGQFDLVMFTERFDESMILMMDELCWTDMSDVMSFKVFVRNPEARAKLSPENENALRLKNRADQIIYDFFYHKFQSRVDAYGKKRMERELERMSNLTRTMNEVCVTYELTSDNVMKPTYKESAKDHELCQKMMKYDKLSFWNKLLNKSKLMKPEVECPN